MQKNSIIALVACLLITALLGTSYLLTRSGDQPLTTERAEEILHHLKEGVAHHDVNAIMSQIDQDPETRIANASTAQLRLLLSRGLQAMKHPHAETDGLAVSTSNGGDKSDGTIEFNLRVTQTDQDNEALDYRGRITLHLKRMEVPHLLGLYKTREWRIVGGSTTGAQPSELGE